METLSDFDFDVEYMPGAENILSDALSRMYASDAPGTVRAPSEYTQYDEDYPQSELAANGITMPVLPETAPDGRKSTKSKANQPEKPAGADSADKLYIRLPARSGTSKQSQKLSTSTSVATDENQASEDGGFSLEGKGDEQLVMCGPGLGLTGSAFAGSGLKKWQAWPKPKNQARLGPARA
ncbi:uncharacterized protein ARMOST_12948 [Armillaria ostoyae]|uniref:Reverse transcriptase RNase H-like domain-containing protein n=1 Tax=Armillaria ostoyae TaxID=47428 RepID=A0A284RLD4_ARMOS|nr:uncharacterized protein ARMOST_12948 [Armillaria ostoyae]